MDEWKAITSRDAVQRFVMLIILCVAIIALIAVAVLVHRVADNSHRNGPGARRQAGAIQHTSRRRRFLLRAG